MILRGSSFCFDLPNFVLAGRFHAVEETPTLEYLIAEHVLLTFFNIFSTLLALIRSCLLNYLVKNFYPALQTIAGKLQWNCSGITAMHFELQWKMACSETLQSAEVNSCKFCSDPNAKSFAVIICRNCSEILHCQNCI